MAAGARRLELRNLIDRYGAQEYFDTLKLQFGFTRRGASRKLADWLDGLGLPIAVRILTGVESECGDLISSSFGVLWKALYDFRRRRVSLEEISALLQASPWIRPQWAPELVSAAQLHANRLCLPLPTIEIPVPTDEPVCELRLRWEYPAKPELSLRLNEERIYEILGGRDSATFAVDGRVVDRWTLQEGGGWRGRRNLPCQAEGAKHNLRPCLLSVSSEGKLLEEVDLLEMGMSEPLLLFDLGAGTLVNLTSKLNPRSDYALICDTDLSVPDVKQAMNLKNRVAYRLAIPWPQDLRVVCNGLTYWEPTLDQRDPIRPLRLKLESLPGETTQIGSACRVTVTGVPEEVTFVSVIARGCPYHTTKPDAVWQTERPLQITLGMALAEERIRIQVSSARFSRTVTPKLSLNLRGIACLETDSNTDAEPEWTLLPVRHALNRADGTGRARVFVGRDKSELFEGPCFVGKISSRTFQLGDLHGWGAPLISPLRGSPRHRSGGIGRRLWRRKVCAIAIWRTDQRVAYLAGSNFCEQGPQNFRLASAISEAAGFSSDRGGKSARRFPLETIESRHLRRRWRLPTKALGSLPTGPASRSSRLLRHHAAKQPFCSFPMAKGAHLESIVQGPRCKRPSFRTPAEFVSGWLGAEALQYGLVHRQAEKGLDTVIREFLWNYVGEE